jgi:hypothetical protein
VIDASGLRFMERDYDHIWPGVVGPAAWSDESEKGNFFASIVLVIISFLG